MTRRRIRWLLYPIVGLGVGLLAALAVLGLVSPGVDNDAPRLLAAYLVWVLVALAIVAVLRRIVPPEPPPPPDAAADRGERDEEPE